MPVRDRQGRVIALKLRPDDGRDGPKYIWISSTDRGGPSPGSPPHVPLGTPAQADIVRLTEGELKADIAFALTGLPTIGISGVDQWKSALPILEAMGARVVHVAFDMDAWTKPGVAAALAACVKELIRLKYEVRLETWDPADGKGIDDLLAAGKQPAVVTGQEVLARIEEIGRSAAGQPGDDADDVWFPKDPDEQRSPRPRSSACRSPSSSSRPRPPGRCSAAVDFLVMVMLAVASAAIGNSRRLKIRPRLRGGRPDLRRHRGRGRGPASRRPCAWSAGPSTSSRNAADGPLPGRSASSMPPTWRSTSTGAGSR